jgi:hypothetical protein
MSPKKKLGVRCGRKKINCHEGPEEEKKKGTQKEAEEKKK